MSLEQQVANLVEASNNLTGAVNGKIGQIDQRMDQAEQDTQTAIDRLNAGHLDSLIIVRNLAETDLSEPKDTYRRLVAQFGGDGDGGSAKFVDLFKFITAYNGHYINVSLTTYQRGRQSGLAGDFTIRANSNPFVTPKKDELLMSFTGGADVSSYIQIKNSSGELVAPNESGVYSFNPGETITVQVLVKQYYQLSAVIDVQTMAG